MQPYSSTHTTTTWKNSYFIILLRSDFHMVISLSIVDHALSMHTLTSVGKIMTYLTSVWLHFVRFSHLTKKNQKWRHTVAFVFAYLA